MRSTACVIALSLGVWTTRVLASIDVSSIGPAGYTQDFDSLNVASSATNWLNDSTLPGWSLFRVNAGAEPEPVPIQKYELSDGSLDMGRFYSFGLSPTERALGGLGVNTFGDGISMPSAVSVPDGSVAGWIAVSFLNNTGATITQFTVSYTGEQWRNAGINPQTMEFEYGFGSTFASVASESMWTKPSSGAPISFNFTSPKFDATEGPVAINGNDIANRTPGLGGTVTGLSWAPNTTLWLRWVEKNDTFADHGLAIDDFSFSLSSSAVPEPGAVLLVGMASVVVVIIAIVRQLLASASNERGSYTCAPSTYARRVSLADVSEAAKRMS